MTQADELEKMMFKEWGEKNGYKISFSKSGDIYGIRLPTSKRNENKIRLLENENLVLRAEIECLKTQLSVLQTLNYQTQNYLKELR